MLNLSSIDLQDHTFEINFLTDLTSLRNSIQRKGILIPICVREKENGSYQIISGFRRFYCAQELGLKEIPAQVITVGNDVIAFENAIEENFFHRSFNIIEKAMILEKLKQHFNISKAEILKTYMPFLGLESSESVYEFCEKILKLDDQLQIYVVQNKLPNHVIQEFFQFNSEEQRQLLRCAHSLYLTVSMLKEFLNHMLDIKMRDHISVQEFLNDPIFREIIASPSLDVRQKQSQFRKQLKLKRFPKLSQLETKFLDLKRKVGLPLEADQFFETNKVNLNLSFSNKPEFERWAQRMNDALNHQDLDELLKIL